jgi:uncharacterized protein YegP (UPF0339 family)
MPIRQQFLVYQANGKYHWKFIANTREIVAVSPEGYDSESECLEAIDMIQDQAIGAPVVDRLFDPTPLSLVR